MENFELIKDNISNRFLKNIYRTKNPISTLWFEGLGNLLLYKFVLQIDNNNMYEFAYDYICLWKEQEKLIPINSSFRTDFINQKILEVIQEEEFNGIYFKLDNGMILNHNIDFGSELYYEEYSKIFDQYGKLID